MKIELLAEPKIEFGGNFLCEDPKMGLMTSGFYSSGNTHRSEIHYAVLGLPKGIELLNEWIASLSSPIQAQPASFSVEDAAISEDGQVGELFRASEFERTEKSYEVNNRLNPDFPGFNSDSVFRCRFCNDDSNNVKVKKRSLENILEGGSKKLDKLDDVVKLFTEAYNKMLDNASSKPDLCYIVIPSEVFKKLGTVSYGPEVVNLRRLLKATLMSQDRLDNIPIQVILEDTIRGTKANLQDPSMVAWNFVTAQYYKTASCIPWALTDIDRDTCFVGISFNRLYEDGNSLLRSSIAQAFNRLGKGLVFVGKQFEWDARRTKVAAPHLHYDYAKELMSSVVKQYTGANDHIPKRIVVYKTTDYWDSAISKEYAEIEGLKDGIKAVLQSDVQIDLVTIKSAELSVLRTVGKYPVMRGTNLVLDDYRSVLYTTGYIPYLETYPGMHMPAGLSVELFDGESTLKNVCREILALTKLNFNNCNYYDSLPITLKFAKKVGEIIRYLPSGANPPAKYYFYM
jgi:hypothetical protein